MTQTAKSAKRATCGRTIDIIDVNQRWGVWVGSRRWGYRIGSVQAPDSLSALRAAREANPGKRIGFVEQDEW